MSPSPLPSLLKGYMINIIPIKEAMIAMISIFFIFSFSIHAAKNGIIIDDVSVKQTALE